MGRTQSIHGALGEGEGGGGGGAGGRLTLSPPLGSLLLVLLPERQLLWALPWRPQPLPLRPQGLRTDPTAEE